MKRIIAVILIALGFVIITFFRGYNGSGVPYPFLFLFLGIISLLSGAYLFKDRKTLKEEKLNKQLKIHIDNLKAKGEKITVDLSKCEIIENDYTEEKELPDSYGYFNVGRDVKTFNALTGDSIRNTELVNVYQAVLVYKQEYNGKPQTFYSSIIAKDREAILFKMLIKKETTLYMSREENEYYFDVEFLND
jgi:hypothetical protein